MLVNLSEILPAAASGRYIVPGFNVFGMDEAWAVMKAAEEAKSPLILMTNKDMVSRYPVELLGRMLSAVAEKSPCPVCVHLDHCYEESILYRAMESGYSSVMFDGSQLSLRENIRRTREVTRKAHQRGVTVEGEIGSVPYPEDKPEIKDEKTDPAEAEEFAAKSGLDAIAVSIGNVHKQKEPVSRISFDLLREIERRVPTPLVLHGTSGIVQEDIQRLRPSRVAKCNIGTILRQAWGHTLREEFIRNEGAFDRFSLTEKPLQAVYDAVLGQIRGLGAAGTA